MQASLGKLTWWTICASRTPLNENDLESPEGKIVIITGANAGLGKATAKNLAMRNAHVILACRDMDRGTDALNEIKLAVPNNSKIDLVQLDLGNFDSIRKFVKEIEKKYPHVNILINNGGIYDTKPTITKNEQGVEMHFAVNHLGHFLLTNLLLKHLKKGGPSRVVTVSSSLHAIAKLDFENLHFEKNQITGPGNNIPYANSKLANIYFTKQLGKMLDGTGVTTYAICPGFVNTDIQKDRPFFKKVAVKMIAISPEKASEMIQYCALSKSEAKETGRMYRNGRYWPEATNALNDEFSEKLWEVSKKLVNLK